MENLNNDDISLCLKSKVSYNMNRHIKLLQEKAENYTLANEKIYRVYNGAIRSYGPISDDYTLSEADEDRVMACLKQNILLTTNGFSYNSPKTWYAVIANRYESYDKYPSKIRSQFKRSYANCQVERISAKWLSKNGWQVYRDAFMRYKDYRGEIWDSNLFENKIALYQDYEDIVHCWGCFVNKELAGFSINNVYGKEEVTYWMIKLSPKYLKYYPVYALIDTMNRNYLEIEKINYVNDGWRSIIHNTGIQEFLIKKFGFFKQYSTLYIKYTPKMEVCIRAIYPFKKIASKLDFRIKAVLELEDIRRSAR